MAVGSYKLEGLAQVQRKMNQAIKDIAKKNEQSIKDVCLDLLGKSKQLAPLDTGELRASGYTTFEKTQDGFVGEVGFGEIYAAVQHEELEYQHTDGEAKYLEKPFKENASKYALHIAEKSKVGGGS
jgi:alpha-D-ribose 1-methylphosphonate 5-triphosphate synthase subunit PhnI